MKRPTKDQLLQRYARRQPRQFTQLDGFTKVAPFDVMGGDDDGHALMGGETYELMSGAYAVRLLVTEGAEKHDVLALLEKMRRWIARDGISLAPPPRLAIKLNNVLTNDPCALCGARTDPSGVDLFLDESASLVCDVCGNLHAPELMRVLNASRARTVKPFRSQPHTADFFDIPF